MKYLCLVHLHDDRLAGMPPRERWAFEEGLREYADSLRRAGHLLTGHLVAPAASGTQVRVRGGRPLVTDADTRSPEPLAAFFLLDARDLNEAIQLAARNPSARLGVIEVRPVRELP